MTNRLISRHRNQSNLSLLMIILFILGGCVDNQVVYYSSQDIPLLSWKIQDSIRFEVDQIDSLTKYQLSLDFRNDNHYRYKNIGLEVLLMKGDTLIYKDTLNYNLTDINGSWMGKGWGSLYQSSYAYRNYQFPYQGSYQFIIHPFMNDWDLKGISSIGLKIKKGH